MNCLHDSKKVTQRSQLSRFLPWDKYDDLLNWHFAIQGSRPGRLEGLSIIFFQMQSTILVLRMALFVVVTTTANLNTLFCDCIQFS